MAQDRRTSSLVRSRVKREDNGLAWVRWFSGIILASALLMLALQADARGAPDSFADLAAELKPTVVNISTTQVVERPGGGEEFEELFREFFERRGGRPMPESRRASSLGSGFVIDAEGYIVTNHHVIAGADEIKVIFHDETELDAELIGSDEKTDLAVLKVNSPTPLAAADWGNSDEMRVGDWVIAIGNPFGLGGTVTAGIISARGRDINAGPYDDFLQTDAAINRGNSGGPMFNMEGEVVGVNSMIISPTGSSAGIGFAIPANMASNIIDSLRSYGEVRRGWLGVRIQTVTEELAEGLRLDDPHGALVASVTKGGPAEAAGIMQGDVIIEFDGRKVEEMRRLPRMVAETPVGKAVEVVVWRKGERKLLEVDLGKLDDEVIASAEGSPPEEPEAVDQALESLGLTLSALTPELREEFELGEEVKGVVITEVEAGGNSDDKGIRAGDVIVEVDMDEVANPGDVASRVQAAIDGGFGVVTLLVYRSGDYQWIAVRLD